MKTGAAIIADPYKILKKFWGFDGFRMGQDNVVASVLSGTDTLVLFPTGGGKSLCYQVPALCMDGLTLVISPLIALMQDQVDQLTKRNIPATFINSSLPLWDVEQRLRNARNGMYKLLYCSPERLQTQLFQHELAGLNISLVAIDEAHCISEWGHEFRPPYRQIRASLYQVEKQVRWMALTATATPEVQADITKMLQFKKPAVIKGSFDRANLNWWVHRTADKLGETLRIASHAEGSGLVYAFTRAGCEQIAASLRQKGISAEAYHGGMQAEKRKNIQTKWISGEIPVVVCTNAFGMGVDKPDCRWVVHHDVSPTLEGYYQEAGRAGRDGKAAYPVLLIHETDIRAIQDKILAAYPDQKMLLRVYDAICDQWQLAIGNRFETPKPVDTGLLAKHTGISRSGIMSSIRMLQRNGILEADEDESQLTGVVFLSSQRDMYDEMAKFSNQKKQAFLDALVRLFGPVAFETLVNRETSELTRALDVSRNALLKGLLVLKNDGYLDFKQSDFALRILLNDGRQEKPALNPAELHAYRDVLLRKLGFVDDFAHSRSCRSRFLRFYFGDENIPKRCGHCDVCLDQHPAGYF